jgi:uncharacterized membrane protein YkvA (DUF1232 family)
MSTTGLVLTSVAALVALYAIFVLALVALGRRSAARALARFIPDCLVLFRRLLADDRVPRSRKLALFALVGYLALPIDLVPDFIPLAGQLDDAILAALVLRLLLRGGGPALLEEHWPGSPGGLNLIRRMAFGSPPTTPAVSRQAPSRG